MFPALVDAGATLVLAFVTVFLTVSGNRRDDRKRAEDRAQDIRMGSEFRRDREDSEARQVLVHEDKHLTVSTPAGYPVTHVEGCTATLAGPGNLSTRPWNYPDPSDPRAEDGRVLYVFKAPVLKLPDRPVIRFIDLHGNLYYQYRGYTHRADPGDDWIEALRWFDKFLRAGPGGRVSLTDQLGRIC